ncbi:hypothetical protein LDENG_00198230 [Lucifuga dentata]|nr:hypothetical protein LDENG_00198230 [Lucifuga dentata]
MQTYFFQLRQITNIKSFLSFTDLQNIIHAFISSRLDYCNVRYSAVADSERCCSAIDFKILLLVFKALHGQAPSYIWDLLTLHEPDRCLRSSGRNLLAPKSHHLIKGDRFAVRAPKLWNSLPDDLRGFSFKTHSKTYFYYKAFL